MTNSVLLSSNIRSNLLALQGAATLLDSSQAKLSTGRKVNSALDNPTSFFTSSALSDRATSLNNLLDGVSNGVQTVKAASTGLDTITSLLKQAKAIATSAKADSGTTATGADSAKALNISTTATGTSIRDKSLSSKLSDNGVAAGETVIFSQVKNGVTSSYTFTNTGGTKTVQDLIDGLSKSGVGSGTVNDNGTLTFSSNVDTSTAGLAANPTNAFTVTPTTAGTAGTPTLGFTAAVATASKNTASVSGQDYAGQFADVVQSINDAVKDASYNGTNLLAGGASNKLSVTFDADSKSKLDVNAQDFTSSTILSGNTTLTGTNTDSVLSSIDSALSSVKGAQGTYGNKLAIMQTRQDFTKSLSTILSTGSDNLVAADTNLEAANVLALQTRQSLSQSALSLANQANQGVLQLLR